MQRHNLCRHRSSPAPFIRWAVQSTPERTGVICRRTQAEFFIAGGLDPFFLASWRNQSAHRFFCKYKLLMLSVVRINSVIFPWILADSYRPIWTAHGVLQYNFLLQSTIKGRAIKPINKLLNFGCEDRTDNWRLSVAERSFLMAKNRWKEWRPSEFHGGSHDGQRDRIPRPNARFQAK